MAKNFLLGVIFAASLVAMLFFLRFWRATRDLLFLAFAGFFLIEGLTSVLQAVQEPSVSPWIYVVRLAGSLLILAAIMGKNLRPD